MRIGALLDSWPFGRKLHVLALVPVAVISAVLLNGVVGQVAQARSAARNAELIRDSAQVASLIDDVRTEHQQALLLSERHERVVSGSRKPSVREFRQAQRRVDTQVVRVRRSELVSRLPRAEVQALTGIGGLGLSDLRRIVEQGHFPADKVDAVYDSAVRDLIDGLSLDRPTHGSLSFYGNLLDTLLRADTAHASFETAVFSAQTGDTNVLIEFTSAVGNYELYSYYTKRFRQLATAEQSAQLGGIENNRYHQAIARQYAVLARDPGSLEVKGPQQSVVIEKALEKYPIFVRQAETRLGTTRSLIGQIADDADRASVDAWWRAAWLLAGSVLVIAAWLVFSAMVRRSVVRPVQALIAAAKRVADVSARELARVTADDETDYGSPQLEAIPVPARDEIGELAQAFNQVQVTAAGLLERQVLIRRNVAEMFGNIGRRVSNLATRQLTLIDAVERDETDPVLLDQLYQIDHIAVRMQRRADSLLLLAGIRESAIGTQPMTVTNALRAALSQIEGYQRVSLRIENEVVIAPDLVGDLVLMLAELLENAVSFSPAHSPVEVLARAHGSGVLIEIVDHGIGMRVERLAEENERLVHRARLDLIPSRVLGLFVVGVLARRWGIGVTLARTSGGGITSRVPIRSTLLSQPPPSSVGGTGSAPVRAALPPAGPAEPPGSPSRSSSAQPVAAAVADGQSGQQQEDRVKAELPRRVPRRKRQHSNGSVEVWHPPGNGGIRPLRRRVRGATLAETTPAGTGGPGRSGLQVVRTPVDPEAVRSSIEEFEEAVARAERDSAAGTAAHMAESTAPAQPSVPEGEE